MHSLDLTLLRDTAARFPEGCTVRRRAGAPVSEVTVLGEAVVSRVVKTGIHGDVFLKTDRFMPQYLDPDWYDVVAD